METFDLMNSGSSITRMLLTFDFSICSCASLMNMLRSAIVICVNN